MHYFKNTIKILSEAIDSLDTEMFLRLVNSSKEVLENGNQIIVTGLGKNVPICEKFVGSMLSLGLRAYFLHTNSAVHGDLGAVHNGDLIIILTKSGETEESIYLAEQLRKRGGVEIWLLTFEKDSTLARSIQNQIVLELEHEGDPWNVMPNNSTTLNLIVLQGLAMRLADELDIKLIDFKKNHPGGYIGVQLQGIKEG